MKKISLLLAFLAAQITFCPGDFTKSTSHNIVAIHLTMKADKFSQAMLQKVYFRDPSLSMYEIGVSICINLSGLRSSFTSTFYGPDNQLFCTIEATYTEPIEPFNTQPRNQ